jgi:hypothetical protein
MKIGCSVRAVCELKKIFFVKLKKDTKVIRLRGGRTPSGGMRKLCKFVEHLDVMNHAIFHLHMMNSLQASRGSKRGFRFEMHMALTTVPCTTSLASDKTPMRARAPHRVTPRPLQMTLFMLIAVINATHLHCSDCTSAY